MFLNNRHYDPSTGVFISVDPLVTITGEPYIYGSANPVTISDPSGLCGCEDFSGYNTAQPTTAISDANNRSRNYWSGPQQHAPPKRQPTGWLYDVGQFGGGITGTPGRLIEETGSAIAHPLDTARGIRHAITNPIETAQGAWGACTGTAQGAGECAGDAIVAYLTGKPGRKWLDGRGSSAGSLRIAGEGFSASEQYVARLLADQGNDVVLRSPTGAGRTSDLLLNGTAYDVYSPTTGSVDRIVSTVAGKGSQVRGGGVVIDLRGSPLGASDLANILPRIQGVSSQISDVIVIDD